MMGLRDPSLNPSALSQIPGVAIHVVQTQTRNSPLIHVPVATVYLQHMAFLLFLGHYVDYLVPINPLSHITFCAGGEGGRVSAPLLPPVRLLVGTWMRHGDGMRGGESHDLCTPPSLPFSPFLVPAPAHFSRVILRNPGSVAAHGRHCG